MKNYEELCFADDFMFCKILQENEDLCKELTELILNRKVGSFVKSEKQKAIQISPNNHGVRFDVYFEDDKNNVYDIEMQKADTKELPKRSRYYQGMIDVDYLGTSKPYADLPYSYVIFLCKFDLFNRGFHKYSFEQKCKEVKGLSLDDGTSKVFICAGGNKNDVSDEMKKFLDYLCGKNAESSITTRIEEKVQEAIELGKWRKEYMTLQEMMQEEFKQGLEQGLEQGEDRKLVKQICKKLTKGKDVKTITDELDEDIELVSGICDVAKDYAPEYDADKVYDAWKAK